MYLVTFHSSLTFKWPWAAAFTLFCPATVGFVSFLQCFKHVDVTPTSTRALIQLSQSEAGAAVLSDLTNTLIHFSVGAGSDGGDVETRSRDGDERQASAGGLLWPGGETQASVSGQRIGWHQRSGQVSSSDVLHLFSCDVRTKVHSGQLDFFKTWTVWRHHEVVIELIIKWLVVRSSAAWWFKQRHYP